MKARIFAGRVHHYLKLLPIYEALQQRGHDVGFIISDNAINIDPSSEFMVNSGAKYDHLYDYLTQEGVDEARELVGEVMESFGWFKHVPPFWMLFSMQEIGEVLAAADNYLEQEKPDMVFGLHENNFWVKPIAYLCKKRGIPHYVFQEGLLRTSDQEKFRKQSYACEYSDKIFVWGEAAAQQYIDAGVPREKIFVSGPVHLDMAYNLKNNMPEHFPEYRRQFLGQYGFGVEHPTVVVAPPILYQYKGNIASDLSTLVGYLRRITPNIILSFHPFEDERAWKPLVEPLGVKVYTPTDSIPLIVAADLLIIQHSTVGLEALALGVPIIEFNFSADPIIQSWVDIGVAELVSSKDQLDRIRNVLGGKTTLNADWLNGFTNSNMLCDGMATERVLEEIL